MNKKSKCDHIIGYHPGEWDNDGFMVCRSNKDDKWIFRDGMFEPFNFCPNCGLPVGDISKEAIHGATVFNAGGDGTENA